MLSHVHRSTPTHGRRKARTAATATIEWDVADDVSEFSRSFGLYGLDFLHIDGDVLAEASLDSGLNIIGHRQTVVAVRHNLDLRMVQ
jgi:hypothetical protein